MLARLVSFTRDERGNAAQEYALIAVIMAVTIPTAIGLLAEELIEAIRAALAVQAGNEAAKF